MSGRSAERGERINFGCKFLYADRKMASGIAKRFAQIVAFVLAMVACLFGAAGRVDWPNGWLLFGFYAGAMALTSAVLLKRDPDLIAERATGRAGMKGWDKLLSTLMGAFGPAAIWIVAGLDSRWTWSKGLPAWAIAIGVLLAACSYVLVLWSMVSNRFFSSVVRIQTERGHVVQSGGPYRFVRHPGYVGMIGLCLAMPLILASYWAFVPAIGTVAVAVLRTALEDRTLRAELAGYAEYARSVHYRLAPGLW